MNSCIFTTQSHTNMYRTSMRTHVHTRAHTPHTRNTHAHTHHTHATHTQHTAYTQSKKAHPRTHMYTHTQYTTHDTLCIGGSGRHFLRLVPQPFMCSFTGWQSSWFIFVRLLFRSSVGWFVDWFIYSLARSLGRSLVRSMTIASHDVIVACVGIVVVNF